MMMTDSGRDLSGFDPSRRDYPQKWKDVPYSSGQRMTASGWVVGRSHDERDNFYTVYNAKGDEVREFRNDLRKALLYAEYAIAMEAASEPTTQKGSDNA
jgi:hypothetical protein